MIPASIRTVTLAAALGLLLSACDESKVSTGPEDNLPALRTWTFSGKELTYKSGIAVRRRDFEGNPTTGLTVWLTDQSIDCSIDGSRLPVMRGGWIGIKYPETSLGKGQVRVVVGNWPESPGLNGNIDNPGAATLSEVDTANGKSVSGSLDFHSEALDPEDGFGKADISGNFTVPYCPGT